jgi:hypothetical protein
MGETTSSYISPCVFRPKKGEKKLFILFKINTEC